MKRLALAAVAALHVSPAVAWVPSDPVPQECNGSYTAAMLDTITKSCKDLRVTEDGRALRGVAMERNEPRQCQEKAWVRIMFEQVRIGEQAQGDGPAATELWCVAARKFFEASFSRYPVVEKR